MPPGGKYPEYQRAAFFCHHVSDRAQHVLPRKSHKSPGCTSERLTARYTQLQGVLPLLQAIVQAGRVEEGAAGYVPGSVPSSDAGPRYQFEKPGKESWAVLDSR